MYRVSELYDIKHRKRIALVVELLKICESVNVQMFHH